MSENFSIEVDNDFLDNFFKLGDSKVPENVTIEDMKKILTKITTKLDTISFATQGGAPKPVESQTDGETQTISLNAPKNPNNVLVVDDLGIVTVQMESLLKKMGFEVTVSRELFDAIEKYKSQDFGYAIVDLFIPTEREGFILIDEIKKMSLLCKLNTKIVVMTASNKKEHREKCMSRGADFYIEKIPGWQKKIARICKGLGE